MKKVLRMIADLMKRETERLVPRMAQVEEKGESLETRVKKLEDFCKIAFQAIKHHNEVLGTILQEEFEDIHND